MKNMLLENPAYKTEKTRYGVWQRYLSPAGAYFAEFRSHHSLFGLPLIHYTRGICPETGTRKLAKGILAMGRIAVGGIAVGQAAFGLIAVGQLAVGLLFGLGQACTGFIALGQLAVAGALGLGQITAGFIAVGQIGIGKYVLAQRGIGGYVWSQTRVDPEALEFFKGLADW
jgi:hypothetical protein